MARIHRLSGLIGVLLIALMPLSACRHTPPAGGQTAIPRGKPPDYATVAAAYNARVGPLERLWSRGVVRVWYPNKEGEEEVAQVEAHLEFIRPDKVNLTLSHAGKADPIAVLGSNEKRYWYFDLGNPRKAIVGEHGRATPERVSKLGLPVYPLDLIELMGVTPLPTSWPNVGTGEAPDLRWSPDGRSLILTTAGRTGLRRMYLNPDTYQPLRIELTGPAAEGGKVLVCADLSNYERVEGAGSSMMAVEVLATLDSGRTRVRLRLNGPATNHSIRPVAFDYDRLVKIYRIEEIRTADEAARPQ